MRLVPGVGIKRERERKGTSIMGPYEDKYLLKPHTYALTVAVQTRAVISAFGSKQIKEKNGNSVEESFFCCALTIKKIEKCRIFVCVCLCHELSVSPEYKTIVFACVFAICSTRLLISGETSTTATLICAFDYFFQIFLSQTKNGNV